MSLSVINLSQLIGFRRVDAEYYQPLYEQNEKIIEKHKTQTLDELTTKFSKGIFDIKADEYTEEGVPFVRINNLRNWVIDTSDIAFISPEKNKQEGKTSLKQYDIILSKTAYPAASIVQVDICNTSQDTIAVKTNQSPDFNFYLVAYLNSKYGMLQMKRLFQGNVQTHLSLPDARTIRIPIPPPNLPKKIRKYFEQSFQTRDYAKQLYADAEALLAAELGLNKLDLSESLFSIHTISDIQKTKRIDAEYYQPKHERTLRLMGKSGKRIADVIDIVNRRFEPMPDTTFQYIEISDVTGEGLVESQTIASEEAPSRAQWVVHEGDVITSTVRPIRRLSAMITEEQNGFVCSSGFAVLKPKDIPAELLLTYLRIPIVCEILDLFTTSSMYPAISVSDLLNIPITLPTDKKIINEIVSKVRESWKARQEAKRLLAEAKSEVERLIEGT